MNEVKLSGKIYNKKEAHTPSGKLCTTFGLSVWNGKKDGNNTYEFMNCKLWGELPDTDGEKAMNRKQQTIKMATQEQLQELEALEVDFTALCKAFKLSHLSELTFDMAEKAIAKKKEQK